MSKVIVISGLPGAGKSTVAKRLARGFERSVHLEADQIQRMIINGGRWPDEDDIKGQIQLRLRSRNVGLLADSFSAANFTVFVDEIYIGDRFAHMLEDISSKPLYFVLLTPDLDHLRARNQSRMNKNVFHQSKALFDIAMNETPKRGLWLDTSQLGIEQTVDEIQQRFLQEALLY